MSLFVQSAARALVVRTADRWHRDCFHQSWECPFSWQGLTFDSSYHTVCSLRWFQLRLGPGPKRLSLQKVEEAKSHLVSQLNSTVWAGFWPTASAILKMQHCPGGDLHRWKPPPCHIGCYECQFVSHLSSGRWTVTALQFQVVRGWRKRWPNWQSVAR